MVLAAREATAGEGKGDGARRRGLGSAPAASFSSSAFSPVSRRLSPSPLRVSWSSTPVDPAREGQADLAEPCGFETAASASRRRRRDLGY